MIDLNASNVPALLFVLSLVINLYLGVRELGPKQITADKQIVDAATSLIKPLQQRVEFLEHSDAEKDLKIQRLTVQNAAQQTTIETLTRRDATSQARIEVLAKQIQALGHTPVSFE